MEISRMHGNEDEMDGKLLYLLSVFLEESSAVTPEDMFTLTEICGKRSVRELSFIVARYTATVINDDEFLDACQISSCSFQVINALLLLSSLNLESDQFQMITIKFLKARDENDSAFLSAYRKVHRKARAFLGDETVKAKIRSFISVKENHEILHGFERMIISMFNFWKRNNTNPLVAGINTAIMAALPTLLDSSNTSAIQQMAAGESCK